MYDPTNPPKKVVLAYSGGVDTTACIPYLMHEMGVEEVIAMAADLGQGDELDVVQEKALQAGAKISLVVDVKEQFITDFGFPAIQANALYDGKYPLSSALGRPLISQILVEKAHFYGADGVAHGATHKGNDQVRFDHSVALLDSSLKMLAPARVWGFSREETIAYSERFGIAPHVTKKKPYAIDLNILGRNIEAGPLEEIWDEPMEEVYAMTNAIEDTPDKPEYIEIDFLKGIPVGINGKAYGPLALVEFLNELAGRHGVGRIDHMENRLVGIKSREIYEAPAVMTLIAAHRELESLTLPSDMAHYKTGVEQKYSELVYNGHWFSPLKKAIDAFIQETQETVSGTIRMKLFKGHAIPVGRKSPHSLYAPKLAHYASKDEDQFNHTAAEGFIYIWGMPTRLYSEVNSSVSDKEHV